MNTLALELTRLIGKKELTFGCLFLTNRSEEIRKWDDNHFRWKEGIYFSSSGTYCVGETMEIIWHPATLSDLHRWMNENLKRNWTMWTEDIHYHVWKKVWLDFEIFIIKYDSSKDLLDQSEETLKQLIDLITSYQ